MVVNQDFLPAIIKKEVRCCIAIKQMAIIFKTSKMTIRQQYKLMFDYFHGTSTIKSNVDSFLEGEGVYEPIVTNATVSIVTETNNSVSSGETIIPKCLNLGMLCLQQEYIIGRHLTKGNFLALPKILLHPSVLKLLLRQ